MATVWEIAAHSVDHMFSLKYDCKALINARVFTRIVTFRNEGVGVYKRLECSQSIFEKAKNNSLDVSIVPY